MRMEESASMAMKNALTQQGHVERDHGKKEKKVVNRTESKNYLITFISHIHAMSGPIPVIKSHIYFLKNPGKGIYGVIFCR